MHITIKHMIVTKEFMHKQNMLFWLIKLNMFIYLLNC
jgi:hypothetical protein